MVIYGYDQLLVIYINESYCYNHGLMENYFKSKKCLILSLSYLIIFLFYIKTDNDLFCKIIYILEMRFKHLTEMVKREKGGNI